MTESFVLLFNFWSLFPNSMARPDVRTHRSHRVAVQQKLTEHRANNTHSRRKEDHLLKDLLFDDAGTEAEDKERRFSERFFGRFERHIPLDDVDEQKVEASFRNGVLIVTVPKLQTAKQSVRRIAINSN